MGRSLSWIVVESADVDAIAQALAVQRTTISGRRRGMPLAGRTLADGRYLIVARGVDHHAFKRRKLSALSQLAHVTFCELEEHVMWSSVERWEHGRKAWSVAHRGEDSPLDLRTTGHVPADFIALKSAVLAQQEAEGGATANVDLVFDLPIDFARGQTHLHPDDAQFNGPGFERLDAGWAGRWRELPFWSRLAVWIAGIYFLAYLAGALYRSLFATAGG
jgi:hypothetical protein